MKTESNLTSGSLTAVVKQWNLRFAPYINGGMSKAQKIHYLSAIVLIGFVAAIFFHYIMGVYLGLPYPYNTFLFIPQDRFNDFFNMYNLSINLNPYFEEYFIKSNYFPFANFIFYLFTLIPQRPSFILFTCIFILPMLTINIANLNTQNKYGSFMSIVILTFLTYPFLFTVDRGNIEGILFVLLYLFIYFKDKNTFLSLVFLSFSIALKLYPAVFLILLLAEKKYKEIVFTLLGVFLLSLAAILTFKGGLIANALFIISGFGINESGFFLNNAQLLSGVGLFSPAKILLYALGKFFPTLASWNGLLKIYSFAALGIFGILAIYIIFIEKMLWKKVALLVFAMLLLPHVSFDYKLILLFVPLILFINSNQRYKSDWFYMSVYALLLIPKSYYFLPHFTTNSGAQDIGIGVILNPFLMITMLIVIIAGGIKDWISVRRHNHRVSSVDKK